MLTATPQEAGGRLRGQACRRAHQGVRGRGRYQLEQCDRLRAGSRSKWSIIIFPTGLPPKLSSRRPTHVSPLRKRI